MVHVLYNIDTCVRTYIHIYTLYFLYFSDVAVVVVVVSLLDELRET